MSLVTRCPKCASEYDVSADQLKLHDGLVRCGECSHVFDGFACLVDSLPTLTRRSGEPTADQGQLAPTTPVPSSPDRNPPLVREDPPPPPPPPPPPKRATSGALEPTLSASAPAPAAIVEDGPFIPSVDRLAAAAKQASIGARQEPALGVQTQAAPKASDGPSLGQLPEATDQTKDEPVLGEFNPMPASGAPEPKLPKVPVFGESRLRGEDPSATGRTVPEFLEDDEEPEPEGVSLLWAVGSLILVLVLIVQAMVVYRNDIVASAPSLRPLLVTLCQPFSCDVSYVRQINRIFIVGSSLQQAPNAQAPLNQRDYVLRLTLQNRGAYPQPWPSLMLTLRDASGTPVVRKAMLPSQYLPPALLSGPMRARQEANLEIALSVDGVSISGYELERFFP